MAAVGISFLVAAVTFVCYKAKWWPFTLFLPASWYHLHTLKPATTTISSLVTGDANCEQQEPKNDISPSLQITHPPPAVKEPAPPPTHPEPSTMPPTPPTSNASDSQLMPPPPVPVRSPKRATSPSKPVFLRSPPTASSGPLPNRNPSRLDQSLNSSLAPPPSRTASLLPPLAASRAPPTAPRTAAAGTVATSSSAKPRKKVILAPGHSPLDWAALTRSATNLSGVPFPQRVTPSQLATMNGRKGKPAWSSFQGKVYNIGPYLPFHPGGEGELRRAAGRVGDKLFMEVHPWVNWENMMGECLVGFLVDEAAGVTAQEEGLDGMD